MSSFFWNLLNKQKQVKDDENHPSKMPKSNKAAAANNNTTATTAVTNDVAMDTKNGPKKNGTTTSAAAPATVFDRNTGICDSILDVIGQTPLVRLNRIGKNDNDPDSKVECELLVKCEFFNAGGSVKDRIGKQMVYDAERDGVLHAGDTLIEPTSGNTGIGLALCAAVRGYRAIITMPEKMSKEKVDILKALGAEIIRTPTEAAFDAPDSHISVARRLQQETPNAHILDQYANQSNPKAHYEYTANEILTQTSGNIDMVVCGVGTGGTISGIAKRLKEHNPNIIVVGVDPIGSILAVPDHLNDDCRLDPYHVEGIGYDFIPNVLDRDLVDVWYKSNDSESLLMMRKLIRDEGLLCGGSSGAAVVAALHCAREANLQKGQRCVIILPDSVRNYMTKALSDDWMIDHGFVDNDVIHAKSYQSWWASKHVYEMPINPPLTITSDVQCKEAISLLKQEGFDMVPVLEDGAVIGVVTEGNITKCILSGRCDPDTSVAESGAIYKTFHKFNMNSTLDKVAAALDHDPFVLIVTEQRCFSGTKRRKDSDAGSGGGGGGTQSNGGGGTARVMTRSVVSGIVSRIDLLHFISSGSSM